MSAQQLYSYLLPFFSYKVIELTYLIPIIFRMPISYDLKINNDQLQITSKISSIVTYHTRDIIKL